MHSKSEEYLAQQIAELQKKERKAAQKKLLKGILIGIGLLIILLGWFFMQNGTYPSDTGSSISGRPQPGADRVYPIDNLNVSTPIGNEGLFSPEDTVSSHLDSLFDF